MKRFHVHVSVDDLDANVRFSPRFLEHRRLFSSRTMQNG